ncbi:MAG: hypothetical protein ACOCXJ_03950 [Planctomycetota bacterium]
MHAVEEIIGTPYLFGSEVAYAIAGPATSTTRQYRQHGFAGYCQRYERLADLMPASGLRSIDLEGVQAWAIDTRGMRQVALAALEQDRLCFVDPSTPHIDRS